MTDISEGLGSMSAMLIIISIIAIGAVMAVRNKMANKRLRRSQMQGEIDLEGEHQQGKKRPQTESETDVNKELDDLKKDVDE